jgi:endonuclease-3
MVTTKSSKPADVAATCRELLAALDKFYGKSQQDLPPQVLESLLLAVCLEDNSWDAAKTAFSKLLDSYFDLNEIRVSSTAELSHTLRALNDPDWKGLRIRSILRHVFESSYSFDFEKLRRQTPELTLKTLKKIEELSPFVREFALQELLGTHAVALDNSMLRAALWLGLIPAKTSLPDAMEILKVAVRKSDASSFCRQLRQLATDPNFTPRFSESLPAELNPSDVLHRLEELITGKTRRPAKKAENPAAPAPAPPPKPRKPDASTKAAPAATRSAPAEQASPPRSAGPKASAPGKNAAPPRQPPKARTAEPQTVAGSRAPAKNPSAKQSPAAASTKKSSTNPPPAKTTPAPRKDRK